MKKNLLTVSAVCILSLSLIFTGCAQSQQENDSGSSGSSKSSTQSVKKNTQAARKAAKANASKTNTAKKKSSASGTSKSTKVKKASDSKKSSSTSDSALLKLKYNGKAYSVINNNNPDFKASLLKKTSSYEKYGKLDKLGRCTTCIARIGRDLMPTEERGSIGMIKPTGWHTIRYDFVDGKYLYNRCHLIGYQLPGENANERNLITGTRYLNIDGMLSFENETADYIQRTGNHVLYRVTPVFKGNELVARGVHMEAESVEDKGQGVRFNVYCFNAEPGVKIDYKTGDSVATNGSKGKSVKTGYEDDTNKKSSSSSSSSSSDSSSSGSGSSDSASSGNAGSDTGSAKTSNSDTSGSSKTTYILNTSTMKFHLPSCSSISSMSEENKKSVNSSKSSLIKEGYSPCGRCNP